LILLGVYKDVLQFHVRQDLLVVDVIVISLHKEVKRVFVIERLVYLKDGIAIYVEYVGVFHFVELYLNV